MKFGLFAAMLLLAGCVAPRPYTPAPAGSRGANSELINPNEGSKNANTFSQDAYECEREAALSSAGGKAEAFNRCMRTRGHGSRR
jgi:hypothetical protein